jgi:hypothetical protein
VWVRALYRRISVVSDMCHVLCQITGSSAPLPCTPDTAKAAPPPLQLGRVLPRQSAPAAATILPQVAGGAGGALASGDGWGGNGDAGTGVGHARGENDNRQKSEAAGQRSSLAVELLPAPQQRREGAAAPREQQRKRRHQQQGRSPQVLAAFVPNGSGDGSSQFERRLSTLADLRSVSPQLRREQAVRARERRASRRDARARQHLAKRVRQAAAAHGTQSTAQQRVHDPAAAGLAVGRSRSVEPSGSPTQGRGGGGGDDGSLLMDLDMAWTAMSRLRGTSEGRRCLQSRDGVGTFSGGLQLSATLQVRLDRTLMSQAIRSRCRNGALSPGRRRSSDEGQQTTWQSPFRQHQVLRQARAAANMRH